MHDDWSDPRSWGERPREDNVAPSPLFDFLIFMLGALLLAIGLQLLLS